MGRTLRNHDIYLEKLTRYCEACELTLEYKEYPNDGAFVPSRRVIVIDRDLDDSTEIATFLHELGHSTDDSLKEPKALVKYDKAYTAFYKNDANEKQKKLVFECEQRAWEYGRGIARKLRIRLGKWYDAEEAEALLDYAGSEQK